MDRRSTRSMTKDLKLPEPPKEQPSKKSNILNKDICIKLLNNLIEQNKKDKYNIKIINPNTGKEIAQNGDTYKKIYNECLTYIEGTSYNITDIPKPGEKKIKETFNDKIKKLTIEDINKWILNPAEEPFDYDYVHDKSINLDIFIDAKYYALYKESFKLLLKINGITDDIINNIKNNISKENIININQKIYEIIKMLPKNHYIYYYDTPIDILLYKLLEDYFYIYNITKINDFVIYYDMRNIYDLSPTPKINITETIIFNYILKQITNYILLIIADTQKIIFNDEYLCYTKDNVLDNTVINNINYDIVLLCNLIELYIELLKKNVNINIDDLNEEIQNDLSGEGYTPDIKKNYINNFTKDIQYEILQIIDRAKLIAEKYDILPDTYDFKLPSDISESPKFPIIHRDINLYKLKRRHNPDYELNKVFEKKIEEYDLLQKKYESDVIKHQAKVQHFYDKSVSDLNSLVHINKNKKREQILKELIENPSDTSDIIKNKCNNLVDINTQEIIADMPLKKLQLLVKVKVRKYHDIDDIENPIVKDFNQQDWTDNNKNPILFTYCYDAFALYNYVVDSVNNNKDPINIAAGHQKKLSNENLQDMVKSIRFINKNRDQRIPKKNIPIDPSLILHINDDNGYYHATLCIKIYDITFLLYHICTFPSNILPSIHTTGIENTSMGMLELLIKLFDSKKLLHKYIYPYYIINQNEIGTHYKRFIKLGIHFNNYKNKHAWDFLSLEKQKLKLTNHYSELYGYI